MTERIATTPFGGGRFTATIFQAHERLKREREARQKADPAKASASNRSQAIDKWELIRALTEAKDAYGLSDRTLAVLEALMTFHPGRELDGAKDIIVFPSNAELGLRARGMSAPTLRRHIAALVEAGMILRRDSANGKRFARRDAAGSVEEAFGFNLAPVALMADDIRAAAEAARAHARAVRQVRGEITLHLRDIAKTIEAAFDRWGGSLPETDADRGDVAAETGQGTASSAGWGGFWLRLRDLSGRVLRHAPLAALEARRDALARLRTEVESAFLAAMDEAELDAEALRTETGAEAQHGYQNTNMNGNDAQNERHIQNSNEDSTYEIDKENREATGRHPSSGQDRLHMMNRQAGRPGEAADRNGGLRPDEGSTPATEAVALGELKQACPGFVDYALSGLNDWRDAREAAELARPLLGISKDAWGRALTAMGPAGAIVVIAYLVERAGDIKSAGGYLRALTTKAEAHKFRVRPLLDSLKNRT